MQEPPYRHETCMGQVGGSRCRKSPKTPQPYPLCDEHVDELKGTLGLIHPHELPDYADRMAAAQMGIINGPDFDQDHWLTQYAKRRAEADAVRWAKADSDQLAVERRLEPRSVVYFIRMGDLIKIGFTSDLKKRVQGLSLTMGHVVATIPGASYLEAQLHERFAKLREHGEWFRAEPELLDYIASITPNRRVS